MIDIEQLEEMFGGEKEITIELFQLYLSDYSEADKLLETYYKNDDHTSLFHTAHTLSGSLGNLCEVDLCATLKEVEASANAGEKANIASINTLKEGLRNITLQMNHYINNQTG